MSTRTARGDHADVVFVNGRILTMDGPTPTYADAVAINRGRIAFVGSRAGALEQFPQAVVRDLDGAALLPGFIDPHSHLSFAFEQADQVNVGAPPVGECGDIASVVAALQDFRINRNIGEGEWIVGYGYDQETLAEARHITKHDLDAAFPDHKVMLIHVSSHGAVLNSAALDWAGIDASTQAPEGGVISRQEGSEEPSGLLMETAYMSLVASRMPRSTIAERLDLIDDVQQQYAANGYTHIQDGFTSVGDLDFFKTAASQGRLYLDVVALGSFIEADDWLGNPSYPAGEYHDGFKIAGMKILQDGSPQGRTACFTERYLTGGPDGQPDWRGETMSPYNKFAARVKQGLDAGVQVFVHANGDATIDELIQAIRDSGVTAADDRRTVAIHSQFQRKDHLDQYVELGITPSYFTNHAYFWGDVHLTNLAPATAEFMSPMKSAANCGLMISNHTDFPVTPLDPFFVLWTSMSRTTRTGVTLGPGERIEAYQALQALTTGAAYQMFEEDRKGRIVEGQLADFVILNADPVRTDVDDIRSIQVLETIKEGVTVYRSGLAHK